MHKLTIKQTSAMLEINLDDFKLTHIKGFSVRGLGKGIVELDVTVLAQISNIGDQGSDIPDGDIDNGIK